MNLPKYPFTHATSKVGINFVRMVVEASNSIFTEIPQQNDIGIDGIVEIIQDEQPTGYCFAVQVKSGMSFYISSKNACHIPVENHALYWKRYPLPVFGIVYIPENSCGYWVNIKEFLDENPNSQQIFYYCSRTNIFSLTDFNKVFIPFIIGKLPDFSYDEAWQLFHSTNEEESYVGLIILFRKHSDKNIVWDAFIDFFRKTDLFKIPPNFIYFLAHIPWHMDISGGQDKITTESRNYAQNLINTFKKDDVVKLLQFIDEENGLNRGSIGQSVEAIVSSIPDIKKISLDITTDTTLPIEIREWADVIRMHRLSI